MRRSAFLRVFRELLRSLSHRCISSNILWVSKNYGKGRGEMVDMEVRSIWRYFYFRKSDEWMVERWDDDEMKR